MLSMLLLLALGLFLLTKGSGLLVDGASEFAKKFGISEFVVGVTIIAIGTSLPELASSLYAAFIGSTDLAVGNVIGSNITNIALIIGVCALIRTIKLTWKINKSDMVLLIGSAFVCLPIMLSGTITRFHGILLVIIYVAYVVNLVSSYGKNHKLFGKKSMPDFKHFLFIIGGSVAVVFGAKLTISAAIDMATVLNISERVIGLTLVALGTSLPELATAVNAAFKGKGGMVIGNIVGSNAFNILGVLGTTAIIRNIPIHDLTLTNDLPIMILASLFFIFIWDRDVSRFEGLVLFTFYLTYLAVLFV